VLHVIESLGRGGAERALVNVLPALRAEGYDAEVAALWPPYLLADALREGTVRVHLLDLRHRWAVPTATARLARLLRSGAFDVAHAHLSFAALYTALSDPLAPRPRRVVTFHNLGYDSYPADTVWRRSRQRFEAHLTRTRFDGYVAVSQAAADHYRRHFQLHQPISIIPNAIPVARLLSGERGEPNGSAAAEAPMLIAPGRLVPEKGHRYLIAALVELRAQGHRPPVLIVGDGPLRAEIVAAVVRAGLQDQVTLRPSLPWEELMELVEKASVFVLASTHEGFPLSPGEAMALGTPVVATAVGGIPELIEDRVSGLLVPPADPGALARAIASVLDDSVMRNGLIRAGRRRVEEAFTPEAAASRLARVYEEVLS